MGRASRLYPFTRKRADRQSLLAEPKFVMVDPEIQFGRPVLTGTGIPTLVTADRYKAGESGVRPANAWRAPCRAVPAGLPRQAGGP